MPRNYTLPTIKTLFGQAGRCAYPECPEPLIFEDRGRTTVVAEIAHIRSEAEDGPRHDPDYTGDVNGPDNLLLLCGKHHKPVDRHESAYGVTELEEWKRQQKAQAGAGISLSDQDARGFARLTSKEQAIIMTLARLTERIAFDCWTAQSGMDEIRQECERTRLREAYRLGLVYEQHENGERVLINDRIQLSWVEQQEWERRVDEVRLREIPRVRDAVREIGEEAAVLRMLSPSLRHAVQDVTAVAQAMAGEIGNVESLRAIQEAQELAVARLWRLANGEEDPDQSG